MAAVRFSPDRLGIGLLKYQPEMHAFMAAIAMAAQGTAVAIAPRSSGHYNASIRSDSLRFADAMARVSASDFKAWWIEYGAGPSPVRHGRRFRERRTLRNATEAYGLTVYDRGRIG